MLIIETFTKILHLRDLPENAGAIRISSYVDNPKKHRILPHSRYTERTLYTILLTGGTA